jgi:hypothetical protein
LNDIFNIDLIIQSDKYYYEENDEINLFIKKRDNFSDVEIECLKYFIIYLSFNYSNKKRVNINNLLNLNFDKLDNDSLEDDFDKDILKEINGINKETVLVLFNYLINNNISDVWDYLKETILYLKSTWYYKKIIINKKIDNYIITEEIKEEGINLKQLYNVSKTLSHNSSWTLLPENFLSLSFDLKKDFFTKLSPTVDYSWLKLGGNYNRQYKFISSSVKPDYNTFVTNIVNNFRSLILNFVFETLVYAGFLNVFETNINITNNKHDRLSIKKAIKDNYEKNKESWEKSFYYVSNEKYMNMKKIRNDSIIFNPTNKYKDISYFDLIFREQNWILFYAMDWVCQISFFKHYIYHQVLYVTGATGQGKSTQVPKLLLYASKMIDYKNNSKIVCTQPRVSPTIGNSTRIAEELGYPIEQSSNNVSYKTRTNNYYVQYKHQKDSHIGNIQSFLRIVTDGTLYEEMKKNTLLFKKYDNDKYYNENLYDILIIDEAHEHNTNMDLILALARQTCYYNNKIKLIIVSATMDDDEPIYRRYYKDINDNLAFPIKHSFIHPILKTDFFINTTFLDRRYHISPPGQTTQYVINETYLDSNITKSLKIQAQEAQANAIKTVLKICSTTTDGNILVFGTGEADIYDTIEKLNIQLSSDIIALPYLSNMNDDYKNIIAKIDKRISNIRNKKSNIHLEWRDKYIEDTTVPYDLYKRAIIIATNVAEASITIPKLRYLVDNGFAKVNKYNKKVFASILDIEEISESSRLQRKGRVGRIDNGDVYYMYPKTSREFIKPKYQITQDSIAMKIIELSSSKTINDIELLKKKSDYDNSLGLINKLIAYKIEPNILLFYDKNTLSILYDKNTSILKNTFSFKSGLFEIYLHNYINCIDINNIKNYSLKTTKKNVLFCNYDGQLMSNLFDNTGEFYLIHPFELNINRNVLNKIISYKTDKINITNTIPKYEYTYILKYLIYNNLLIDSDSSKLFVFETDINNNLNYYMKTELSDKLLELSADVSKNLMLMDGRDIINQYSLSLISSVAMGCYNQVVEIILLTSELNMKLSNIYSGIYYNWDKFKEKNRYMLKNSIDSDLIFLHKIIELIKEKFKDIIYYDKSIKNYEFNYLYKTFLKHNEPVEQYSSYIWNKLTLLKNNGTIVDGFDDIYDKIDEINLINILENNLKKYESQINSFCSLYELNSNIITKFIRKLAIFNWNDKLIKNDVLKWANKLSNIYNRLLTTNTLEEKIVRSFLYGTPYNYTFYSDHIKYKGINCNLANEILLPINNKSIVTMTNNLTLFSFLLNNAREGNKSEESDIQYINPFLLSSIDVRWLIPVNPFYFNSNFKHSVYNVGNNELIYLSSSDITLLDNTISNNYDINNNIWNNQYTPILQYYYQRVLSRI